MRTTRIKGFDVLRFGALLITLIISMFPIYWMLVTSLKGTAEIYQDIPTFVPKNPSLNNYIRLFGETSFLNGLKNSLVIAFTVAAFTILIAYPAAYAIGRLRFGAKRAVSQTILFTYLIPAAVLFIPLFMMLSRINLNSTPGLMLIYPTFTVPYATWILIPYLASIPIELEESAMLDGCSRYRSMIKVVLPLASPGVATTFIFSFTLCWGEYLYALVNINNESMRTFPLVISRLIVGDLIPWGQLMSAGIVACLPILLIYLFASNLLVSGLTAGGVKQ